MSSVGPEKEIAKSASNARDEFDRWLQSISNGYITLDRLGALPILGNTIAAVDTIISIRNIYIKGHNANFIDWLELILNFIGVVPALGNVVNTARYGMRPLLHLAKNLKIKEIIKNGKNSTLKGELSDAIVTLITQHINSHHFGDPEKFILTFQSKFDNILSITKKEGRNHLLNLANELDILKEKIPVKVINSMSNGKISESITNFSNSIRQQAILFSSKIDDSRNLIFSLLEIILQAVRTKKKAKVANVSPKNNFTIKENNSQKIEHLGKTGPNSPNKPNSCKNGCSLAASKKSIDFATGQETFTHVDFTLSGLVPLVWSRTYCSGLISYNKGSQGSRWITPYIAHIAIRRKELLYHSTDGRAISFPLLKAEEAYHHPIEDITLMRISDDLLTLNVGKELLEVYEKHGNIFRLTAIKDRQGNSTGLHYHGSNLVAINDSNGHHITFTYNSQKLISQINLVSAEPRVLARYEYNKEGDLIRAYDEFGDVYEYTYQNHLITRYTDKTGRGINLKWNGKRHTARCIHEYDDNGDSDIRLTWIDDENETVVTDAYGNQTSYFYDTDNYTYRIIYPDHTEEWFFRDDRKNVTAHIHLDGSEDNYVYDDHDNLLEHIRADGSSVQYEYDADNNLIQIIDPLGNKWQRDYDAKGNLIAETNPEGETTHYAYNERGLPIQVIDAKGGSKTIQWTADGQIASHTDCSGHTSHWDYDERGRLIAHIDAEGNKTQYQYDQRSQPNKITFPDQSEEQYHFDAEGRLLSYTDALKRITTYQYDRSGRVAERTDPMGYHVRYHYDKNNRLSRLTDANGAHYTFQYNPMGSLLEEKGFDGKVTRYHYTQGSGVLSRIDEAGLQTVLEYDEMGRVSKRSRLTTHQLASGQIEQLVDDEHYLYDANGRLIESKNQDSRIQLFYDSLGNLLKEHHRYSFLGKDNTFVWRHQYDVLGNRTETLRPDGHRVAYLRYGSGHLHGITLNQHEIIAYQRDRLHRETERQMAKLSQQTVYDTMGRITQQNRVGFNERHRQYRYDMAGQMSHIRDSKNGTTRYQYDPLGRLIEAVTPLRHERFAFDPAGNRLDGLSGSYSEKETTLNSVWGNLLKNWLGKHHEYDQRGNLIAKSENGKQEIFRWNGYNRLIQYTKDNQTTEYKYDPFGRRIAKIHNGTTTLFHWDGDVLSAESDANGTTHYIFEPDTFEPVAQFNSVPLRPQAPLTFRDYTYYTPEIDPLNQEPTPQEYLPDSLAYFHLDHLGTPIEMTDQTGNTVWEASYKAWGEVETVSGSLKQPFRFQGQYFDEESGLHYNRFRYYDPISGRFVSQDPIGLLGGGNLYGYVDNPNQWVDVFGLQPTNHGRMPSDKIMPTKKGYQRQHLIPYSLRNHEVFVKSRMNINSASNLMYMPVCEGIDSNPNLGLHRGWTDEHRKYNLMVAEKLNAIRMRSIIDSKNNQQWDYIRYQQEVQKLQQELRLGTKTGKYTCASPLNRKKK